MFARRRLLRQIHGELNELCEEAKRMKRELALTRCDRDNWQSVAQARQDEIDALVADKDALQAALEKYQSAVDAVLRRLGVLREEK